MTREQYQRKLKNIRKRYPVVLSTSRTNETIPWDKVTNIGAIFVDIYPDNVVCYFDVFSSRGKSIRFKRNVSKRYHIKEKKFLWFTIKEKSVVSHQDYFDNPCEDMKELQEVHDIVNKYLYTYKQENTL